MWLAGSEPVRDEGWMSADNAISPSAKTHGVNGASQALGPTDRATDSTMIGPIAAIPAQALK